MSEGTGAPGEWASRAVPPEQGQQPGTPGQAPQPGQPPVPPPGGFGPPATPYVQPGAGVPPQAQPPVAPHLPSGAVPYPQPGPQGGPQPGPPQPVPPQPGPPQPPAPFAQWPQQGAQPPPLTPQPSPNEPDWNAMADRHATDSRRRKRLWIGAVVAAAVLVGGVVGAGVWINGRDKGDDPKPNAGTSTAGSPSVTATPTEQALAVISDAATDKLPVDAATLFPDQTRTVDGKVWTRQVTGSTAPCSKATTGGLGLALGDDTCRSLVRATYVNGESAVTVGVAVFDNKAGADRAIGRHAGLIQGLSGTGVAMFCVTDKSGCAETHASIGRFGYFTVAGSLKQGADQSDQLAAAAAGPLAGRTKDVLLGRGTRTG
ncbi:hypothetical protein ABTX81_25850 [Kitasatospora sp. NPDC097605]|uniref:hypothetical protein n=1 Tax=Kitasatospora sp. NPDC097605 TaxID=3157226 RepID=UPI003321EFA5